MGSSGAIPKQFVNRLKQIGVTAGTAQVQKTVFLGSARILRKVLEICGSILLCVSSIIIIIIIIIIITIIKRQEQMGKEIQVFRHEIYKKAQLM